MKHVWNPAPRRLPLIGTLALLVAVLTLATIPMAMAKYKATGTGNATARIAKWDPIITLGPGWPTTAENKYVLQNAHIGMTSYDGLTFTAENKGETLISIAPSLVNPANNTAYPNVDFTSSTGSMVIGFNQTITVTMTIGHNTDLTAYQEYKAELRVAAVQVD